MKRLLPIILVSFLPLFIFSSAPQASFSEVVKGMVIDNSNHTPVEKAYIYIVSGEEEALSLKDGSFEITTWQAFPVTLQIKHEQYKATKIVYKNAAESPLIKLQSK